METAYKLQNLLTPQIQLIGYKLLRFLLEFEATVSEVPSYIDENSLILTNLNAVLSQNVLVK